MNGKVEIRSYGAPPVDRREILRYAGVRGDSSEMVELMETCMGEIESKLAYSVCFRRFSLAFSENELDLGFAKVTSASLQRNLCDCEEIVVFAATVGLEVDRMIARAAVLSPAKALMMQAIATERVEGLCDHFTRELAAQEAERGREIRPRFSAGYGDLPLSLQKRIFDALDCPRSIGLSLNESLLMSPTKSVTAIVGIAKQEGKESMNV